MKPTNFKGFDKGRQKEIEQKLEILQVDTEGSLEKLNKLMATSEGQLSVKGVLDAFANVPPQSSNTEYMEAYDQTNMELQHMSSKDRQAFIEMIPALKGIIKGKNFLTAVQDLHK